MEKIKYILVALTISVACFVLGKYSSPTKTEIKEVEKIVYKESATKKTDTNRETEKVITIKPDGTKVTEIKTKSNTKTDSKTETDITKDNEKSSATKNRPGYRVNLMYFPNILKNEKETYILDIQRNIFSELYLGVSISTEKTIGISISLGF